MSLKKFGIGLTAALLIGSAAISAAPGVTVGATVYDTAGATVGTIDSLNGDLAVVSTGTNKVSLPLSSFGTSDKGPTLGMTKVQLDAAAAGASASAAAQLKAQLTSGATIYGVSDLPIGTISAVDAEYVTLDVGAQKLKIPVSAFVRGNKGPTIGMTADQLKAAAAPPQAAASSTTATPK